MSQTETSPVVPETQEQKPAAKQPGRFNPSIVYPVGRYSFRRSPTSPITAWEVLSGRPDPRTKLLPEGLEVLAVESSGKLARAVAEKLEAAAKLNDRPQAK